MWKEHKVEDVIEVYGEMLAQCFAISWDQLEDSAELDHICEECVKRLRDANEFKKVILESQKKLKEQIDDEHSTCIKMEYDQAEKEETEQYLYDSADVDTEDGESLFNVEVVKEETEYEEIEYLEDDGDVKEESAESSSSKHSNSQNKNKRKITQSDVDDEDAEPPKRKWPKKLPRAERYKTYKQYTQEQLLKCMEAVRTGVMTPAEASESYTVPRKTILAKMKEGPKDVLTDNTTKNNVTDATPLYVNRDNRPDVAKENNAKKKDTSVTAGTLKNIEFGEVATPNNIVKETEKSVVNFKEPTECKTTPNNIENKTPSDRHIPVYLPIKQINANNNKNLEDMSSDDEMNSRLIIDDMFENSESSDNLNFANVINLDANVDNVNKSTGVRKPPLCNTNTNIVKNININGYTPNNINTSAYCKNQEESINKELRPKNELNENCNTVNQTNLVNHKQNDLEIEPTVTINDDENKFKRVSDKTLVVNDYAVEVIESDLLDKSVEDTITENNRDEMNNDNLSQHDDIDVILDFNDTESDHDEIADEDVFKELKHNLTAVLQNTDAAVFRWDKRSHIACCLCRFVTKNCLYLKRHVKKHEFKEEEIAKILSHEMVVFIDVTKLKCKLCNKNIHYTEHVIDHLNIKHSKALYTEYSDYIIPFIFQSKGHKCVVCNKVWDSFNQLMSHIYVHYKNYQCPVCNKHFETVKQFKLHAKQKNGRFHNDSCKSVLQCTYCMLKFKNLSAKKYHEKFGLKSGPDMKCEICSKIFVSTKDLIMHEKRIHKFRVCLYCNKVFCSKIFLNLHISRHIDFSQPSDFFQGCE